MIKLVFSLFFLRKGTLKARFLLEATVLRLHDGKRRCNLWQVLSLIRQQSAPLVEGGNIALFKSFLERKLVEKLTSIFRHGPDTRSIESNQLRRISFCTLKLP